MSNGNRMCDVDLDALRRTVQTLAQRRRADFKESFIMPHLDDFRRADPGGDGKQASFLANFASHLQVLQERSQVGQDPPAHTSRRGIRRLLARHFAKLKRLWNRSVRKEQNQFNRAVVDTYRTLADILNAVWMQQERRLAE